MLALGRHVLGNNEVCDSSLIDYHALDPDEDVHVPLVAVWWSAAAQAISETSSEFITLTPHRLVGDENTTFRQDELDISETEAEHVVEPHGVTDDLTKRLRAVTMT
jgi:hypothetical protein